VQNAFPVQWLRGYDAGVRYGLYLADLRPAQNDSRGTINYAVGLASALPPLLGPSEELYLLANPEVWAEIHPIAAKQTPVVDIVGTPGGITSRLALDHVRSIRWARRRRLDVLHFPKGHLPVWIPGRLATIATVHDDIPVRYARNEFGAGGRSAKSLYFARTVAHAVAAADRVLTVSAFSAQGLARLAPVDPMKLIVTYEAPTLPPLPFVALSDRDPTILILGSRFPHKRTAQALEWSQRFTRSSAGSALRVVVTGQLDPDTEQACAGMRIHRVRGVLSSVELARLVARSRVLVFGSAYEGFGLPPVEAYSLGTPATYQSVGAMAEVLDGFPGGYEEPRYDRFAQALAEVMALDGGTLLELQARMRQRFRWSEVARITLDAYRSAAGELRKPARRLGTSDRFAVSLLRSRKRFRPRD
jgi:glycosyltransferase involved in cell wall biosynthesis